MHSQEAKPYTNRQVRDKSSRKGATAIHAFLTLRSPSFTGSHRAHHSKEARGGEDQTENKKKKSKVGKTSVGDKTKCGVRSVTTITDSTMSSDVW